MPLSLMCLFKPLAIPSFCCTCLFTNKSLLTSQLFENNISRVANAGAFAGKEEQLNRAVAEHLLRAGHFYTLEEFERVSKKSCHPVVVYLSY